MYMCCSRCLELLSPLYWRKNIFSLPPLPLTPPPFPLPLPPPLQRLRHLHYYLWILAYGRDPIEEGEPVEEKTEGADGEMDTIKRGKEKKTDSILPETNFPWAKAVDKLPQSSKGEGWVQFSELHHRIPLSLWLILIKMYKGVAVSD